MLDGSNLPHGTYIEQYYIDSSFFKVYVTNHTKLYTNCMENWINFCFCIAICIKYFFEIYYYNHTRHDEY